MSSRRFCFGVVAAGAESAQDWLNNARRIEELGFATMVIPDGLQHTLSPFPALAAAAAVTRQLRVGTYVIANDYRHPVMLAKEAASLDLLTGGRFELGIGAGRPAAAADVAMLGLPFASGVERVERLAEALRIIKPLLAGEAVDFDGSHYSVRQAVISPLPVQRPVPLLIGAARRRLVSLAAQEADVIALGVGPDATEAQVDERVGWIREAGGQRFAQIELNLNLMAVGGQVPRYLQMTLGDRAGQLAQSDAIPVLKGGIEQMCDRLCWLRERFGVSYIMVGDELMAPLAPIVQRLAGQ